MSQSASDAGKAASKSGSGRVLLVDDEPGVLRGMERALSSAGYDVSTAGNGNEALSSLMGGGIDVVVSDISMPEMDGVELLRTLRAKELDIPVVLMTGSPDVRSAVRAVELGALRYLIKPFEMNDLIESLGKAVAMHKLAKVRREALTYLDGAGHWMGDRPKLEDSFTSCLQTLWMAFQPIVHWPDRRIVAYEALVRTTTPDLPHPGALLAAAERLGRLHELGRVLRERVATQLSAMPLECEAFVNLHSQDLNDEALYEPGAPLSLHARRIVLEITERASLDDVHDLKSCIKRLRALGYRVAVDDLGAGYAGLTSFAHLEPDVVKLDMSLVRGVHGEPVKQRLVQSMTQLCKDMGIAVVGEGVETPAERDCLKSLGCDLLQGYHFAKPGRPFPVVNFG